VRPPRANGRKEAAAGGSWASEGRERCAVGHPNVRPTPGVADQNPTWGLGLVHALVRAQFGLDRLSRGRGHGRHSPAAISPSRRASDPATTARLPGVTPAAIDAIARVLVGGEVWGRWCGRTGRTGKRSIAW